MTQGPAIAVLELGSIARGYVALDAACKRAMVEVLRAEPVSPGKYWIVLAGGEAEIDEALDAGITVAADARLDHALLPAAHPALVASLRGLDAARPSLDSVGAIELGSMASAVRATDAALKAAEVRLVDLHLARGIGGRAYLVVTGDLCDVEAAVDAGVAAAETSWLIGREVIANPDAAVAVAVARRRAGG